MPISLSLHSCINSPKHYHPVIGSVKWMSNLQLFSKILLSTFIGSFAFSCLFGIGFMMDGNYKAILFIVPFATVIGFFSYGIMGSLIWYLFYTKLYLENKKFSGHIKSSIFGVLFILAVSISWYIMGWIGIAEVITGIIMSSVGALFSVFAYRIIFYRNEDNYI
mgnify:CR=1 FL=1